MDKKGVEINITTIVVVILALLVLVVLALFFTGGMKNLWGKITPHAYDMTDIEIARNHCSLFCSAHDKMSYCNHEFSIRKTKDNEFIGTDTMYCHSKEIKAYNLGECKAVGFGKEVFCEEEISE